MKKLICLLASCLTIVCVAGEKDSNALPRSTPEKQGISSQAIRDFVDAADKQGDMHSFVLLRHGCVVAEGWWSPYGADIPHTLFSLSKSFTSTAVGLAVAEAKLSLDDEVLKFFPEDAPAEPDGNLKAMRIRDLLRMSTGQHSNEVAKFSFQSKEKLTQLFLSLPVEHKPGTFFWYNSGATYMLSAMVQKATGSTVLDYLRPRLFEPLGIENPVWAMSAQGIALGATGLKLKTEDIARFGQLYLQKGQWHGKQLVPAAWIETATALQTSNGSNPTSDWEQGYGYQFWRCRHGFYRGDGAHGQFCIVMPELDAVIAINSGTTNMQRIMNLVWDKLVPAMQTKPLHANAQAQLELKQKLAGLSLGMPQGNPTSPLAATVAGRKYLFPTNDQNLEAIRFEFSPQGSTIVIRKGGSDERIASGQGSWQKGNTSLLVGLDVRPADPVVQPIAVSGAWTTEDTYTAKLWFYETPLALTYNFRFAGDQVFVDFEYNISSVNLPRQSQVVGQAQ